MLILEMKFGDDSLFIDRGVFKTLTNIYDEVVFENE